MKDFIIPWTDTDKGTPARTGAPVTLTVDGFEVTVPEGTSVMRAASEAGIQVPKLCATDSLEAFGSCRLCVVEIEGRRGTPSSCTTPVAEGMVVRTQSKKVQKIRRGVMELYISDHPLDCLTCAANGDCELQDMAGAVGLRDVRYAPGENHFEVRSNGEENRLRSLQVHRLLALRARLRGGSRHLRAHHRGPGLRQPGFAGRGGG